MDVDIAYFRFVWPTPEIVCRKPHEIQPSDNEASKPASNPKDGNVWHPRLSSVRHS
jgi:hypothetical protein